jgi:hypothetical protein
MHDTLGGSLAFLDRNRHVHGTSDRKFNETNTRWDHLRRERYARPELCRHEAPRGQIWSAGR